MGVKINRLGACGLDLSGSGWGLVAGSCGHDNEPLGSIKVGNFLIMDSTPCS
jgi:hypothetical protein